MYSNNVFKTNLNCKKWCNKNSRNIILKSKDADCYMLIKDGVCLIVMNTNTFDVVEK